jgi:hypothetical protein
VHVLVLTWLTTPADQRPNRGSGLQKEVQGVLVLVVHDLLTWLATPADQRPNRGSGLQKEVQGVLVLVVHDLLTWSATPADQRPNRGSCFARNLMGRGRCWVQRQLHRVACTAILSVLPTLDVLRDENTVLRQLRP